jgi:hypothetical protein
MFERKIPESGRHEPDSAENGEEVLRDLSWPELAARLSAARDLRQELGGATLSGPASFDPGSARSLRAGETGKPAINPFDLAHGKQPQGKTAGTSRDANTGNRGSE